MSKQHELHIVCGPYSRKLRRLRRALPDLRAKKDCDPNQTPANSLCFEYPIGREAEFESAATSEGLAFEWGVGPDPDDSDALFAVGDYLYTVSTTTQRFRIFDIATITGGHSPVGELTLAHPPTCLFVYGTKAYVGCSDGALLVVNVDVPTGPVLSHTVLNAGENWSHVWIVGNEIYLSGPSSSGVGIFDQNVNPPRKLQIFRADGNAGSSQAVTQARRLFFADAVGGTLYSYRIGGFRCTKIETGSIHADHIFSEEYRGRHLYLKGSIVAREITVLGERGEIGSTFRITLGSKSILWSDSIADPNTLITATISSIFMASDGTVWRNTDGVTAWTAM